MNRNNVKRKDVKNLVCIMDWCTVCLSVADFYHGVLNACLFVLIRKQVMLLMATNMLSKRECHLFNFFREEYLCMQTVLM